MRHKKAHRRLGRSTSARKALLRSLTENLFLYKRIETTTARAKELRKIAEKMITLAKKGTVHSRRQVLAFIPNKKAVKKLFDEIAKDYSERKGGYIRIIKKGKRLGDAADIVIVELI